MKLSANKLHINLFTPFLSLNRSLRYITADAFMIREKLGINFAQLIPEVSAGERDGENKESARPEKERKKKMKEGKKTNHQAGICGIVSE